MTEKYTPSEEHFRDYYVGGRSEYDPEYTDDMGARRDWDRFIEAVKRDAAREALDGLADQLNNWAEADAEESVRIYRDTHYPEGTP